MKTIRIAKKRHVNSKSGSYGSYIRLSSKRGVKVFSETRISDALGRDGFDSRLEVENDASYYEIVNGEFQCMAKAYKRLGDLIPKPIDLVSVKIGSKWYLGIIMSHCAGQTLGAKFDRVLSQNGTDFESEDLGTIEDFQTYADENGLDELGELTARYIDLLSQANDKGVSYRDDHPWNVIYNAKTDRLTLIDFNPKFVSFPDTSLNEALDQVFQGFQK